MALASPRSKYARALFGATTALAVVAASLTPASANVGSDMNSFFSDMGGAANASGPTAYQGQSAGYYTLGSVWTRFPQKTVYPANLQLPKVRAGCGGIDIFAGSFSFINASEFVAMLKAVANNAIGFAFKLAIDSISPQIGGVIDEMQDIANKINQFNMNSCEQAAALVGNVWPQEDLASQSICEAIGTSQGIFSDTARARHGCGQGGQRTSTINGASDPALKALAPGPKNYAWDMIEQSPLASQSEPTRELLMTLIGTIIVPQRASDDDQPNIQYIGGQVGPILDALLDGTQSVTILNCSDTDKCLSTGTQTLSPLGNDALTPHVRRLIISISDKIQADQALTNEEQQLLGLASIPLYKVLAVQAASGFRLSAGEIDSLAEITSIDLLNAIMSELLDQVAAARGGLVNQGDAARIEQFMVQLRDVRQRVGERDAKVSDRVGRTLEIVNRAMMIESTLQNKMAPGMAASLSFSRALSAQGMRP
ncbi:conjugal transfer protein TraH [Novosphingobium sp. G106]|uniref:conjugal transfer protein TraH n=1 Tax=Novosphingobium sp. G106 TaxID=2849500 RepID=UPI0020C304BF|nr:conjugal transfer protein TraH [Novosphingobium sp. G106]